MPERRYVETPIGPVEWESFVGKADPPLWLKLVGCALLLAVFALVLLPFQSPFRERLGSYVYVHTVLVVAGGLWVFLRLLPPPFKATERMRCGFLRCLRQERVRRLGLDRVSFPARG